jgi:hypothetical protein
VADPPERKLRGPRHALVLGLLLVEKGCLGEVVARASPRARVDLGELAVAPGSEHGQDEREEQPGPHVWAGRGAVVGLGRLRLEGRPEERPRSDERHAVDGDAGEGEALLELRRCFGGRHGAPSCGLGRRTGSQERDAAPPRRYATRVSVGRLGDEERVSHRRGERGTLGGCERWSSGWHGRGCSSTGP